MGVKGLGFRVFLGGLGGLRDFGCFLGFLGLTAELLPACCIGVAYTAPWRTGCEVSGFGFRAQGR